MNGKLGSSQKKAEELDVDQDIIGTPLEVGDMVVYSTKTEDDDLNLGTVETVLGGNRFKVRSTKSGRLLPSSRVGERLVNITALKDVYPESFI